jgi:hypothetical protein
MENLSLQQKFGHFIGEPKKAGETRILRNILLSETDSLRNSIDGKKNFKEIFEARVREVPEKLFLGTRAKIFNEETKSFSFGEYQWKTFSEIH